MCVFFFEVVTKWAIYITHLGVQLLEAVTLAFSANKPTVLAVSTFLWSINSCFLPPKANLTVITVLLQRPFQLLSVY